MSKKKPKLSHRIRRKRHKFARGEDGQRVAVLRAKDPRQAATAHRSIQARLKAGTIDAEEAHELSIGVVKAQPHTFIGLLSTRGDLLDEHGHKHRGRKRMDGDSYVPYEWLVEQHAQTQSPPAAEAQAS